VLNKGMVSESKTAVRVLVADDDEVFLEILAEMVENAGAGVVLAPDGLVALEHLAAADFDILITDLNMPRMDGLALLRHVRSTYPHILSILVTGFGSLESAIEALRLGVYDYIQKPFMVEQVAVTIRNAIERVRIFREKLALLEKIEILNKRLYLLEGKRNPEYEIYDKSGQLIGGPLYLDPGNFRSDTFLEKPEGNANRAIVALEALKGLRRDGVISELELERLKRVIIRRIESARP
jgi:DNA-binding response OmpR family regulator